LDIPQSDYRPPGQHYRPPTSADVQFNQRTLPAVLVAFVGYGALVEFTPYEIGVGIWALLALVAIPAVCGLVIHSIGDAISASRRAKRASLLVLVCFVVYGLWNMSVIHDKIQAPSSGAGAMPAMLLAAAGYGLVAALVAGLVASLPVHHHEEHGY